MIIKNLLKNNFTIIPNEIFKIEELDIFEKYFLIYLYSLPENYKIKRDVVADHLKISKDKIRKVIKKLEELGIIAIERGTQNNIKNIFLLNLGALRKSLRDVEKVAEGLSESPLNNTIYNTNYNIKKLRNNKQVIITKKKETFFSDSEFLNSIELFNNLVEYYEFGSKVVLKDNKISIERYELFKKRQKAYKKNMLTFYKIFVYRANQLFLISEKTKTNYLDFSTILKLSEFNELNLEKFFNRLEPFKKEQFENFVNEKLKECNIYLNNV